MKTQTERPPRAGEIVMSCVHLLVRGAAPGGAHLMRISGGPRVFSNLDDRFWSEWLYFCDDCHRKASADTREVTRLIRGPMEWISDCEEMPHFAAVGDRDTHDVQGRSGHTVAYHG